MLLCASNADHTKVCNIFILSYNINYISTNTIYAIYYIHQVDPLSPPADAAIGELISFAENIIKPVEPGNKATKSFGKIADDFYVDDSGVATFRGVPFMTTKGPVTSTLKGKIS